MKKLKSIIKCIFSILLNSIMYIISLFIPKSKKIWIFGGWFGNRFADNSRYLYLYCHEHKDEIGLDKAIWITDNDDIYADLNSKGFEVYKKWSFNSIWYHLRAKVVFVDQGPTDINKYFCIRTIKINLWHGFPLKKIGALSKSIDFNINTVYNKYFKIGGWSNYYLQATSDLSKNLLGESFKVSDDKVFVSGYARNDVFTQNYWKTYLSKEENEVINKINDFKNKGFNIIFYLPTFRDNKDINLLNLKNKKDIKLLTEFLENNKILLITKFHFAQNNSNLCDTLYDNILNLESNTDVYPILYYSDILITDYSSVYFDFLITNKPILFYPFDLEYYSNEKLGRGLIFDYDEFTPGDKTFNIKELVLSIEFIINNPSKYCEKYKKQYEKIKMQVFDKNISYGSYSTVEKVKNLF